MAKTREIRFVVPDDAAPTLYSKLEEAVKHSQSGKIEQIFIEPQSYLDSITGFFKKYQGYVVSVKNLSNNSKTEYLCKTKDDVSKKMKKIDDDLRHKRYNKDKGYEVTTYAIVKKIQRIEKSKKANGIPGQPWTGQPPQTMPTLPTPAAKSEEKSKNEIEKEIDNILKPMGT